MIELHQLEQLIAISEYGTISKAAEYFYISQPALSRSMQRLEDELQVKLFDRQKNKITLNQNGQMAVTYAQKILSQTQSMITHIQAYDRSQRTISIGSCAPAPLWELMPFLTKSHQGMTISCEIKDIPQLREGLKDHTYSLIVLPYPLDEEEYVSQEYMQESLFFSFPPEHRFANRQSISFEDMDGETMLLYSEIGFWYDMHKKTMPHTHFLIQKERPTFKEIVNASSIPSFTSDMAIKKEGKTKNRTIVPITNEDAHVTFYICYYKKNKDLFKNIQRHHFK